MTPGDEVRVMVSVAVPPALAFEVFGTQVKVTHRGWAALRGDHPARHGQAAPAFIARHGRWWGDLLMRFRLFCGGRTAGPESQL